MAEEHPAPTIRIAPIELLESYQLPARPPASSGPAAQDSHRQTQFLLAGDLTLFEQAMNLQLRLVADSKAGKYRTPAWAALVGLWARSFTYLADAYALAARAAYASALPLLRAACDCVAAQHQLATQEMDEFTRWLAQGIGQDRRYAAQEFALGRYHAGEALASHERLGAVYRIVSDLSATHFGSTALLVASGSNPQRFAILFADNTFHLGWAELVLGWLLAVADVQLEVATSQPQIFPLSEQVRTDYSRLARQIREAAGNRARCHIEEVTDAQGRRRYLCHNFRRQTGSAPRKLLL